MQIKSDEQVLTIDLAAQKVSENGKELELAPNQWRLLAYFLSNPQRLLTKDMLIDAVWRGQAVTDQAVSHAVRLLRDSLGDDAKDPRYIQTVHRRGYRFIAEISEPEEARRPGAAQRAVRRVTAMGPRR